MISPDPYNELKCLGLSFISYILQQISKFLSNSEIVRVQASKAFHHLVGMTVEALVLKKCYNFPDTQWQKKVAQWSKTKINSIISCGNNGKKISSTFFLSHQNITRFDWVIDMDSFLFLWYFGAKIGAIPTS